MIFKSKASYLFLVLVGLIGCSAPIDVSGDNQMAGSDPTPTPYIDQFIPDSMNSQGGSVVGGQNQDQGQGMLDMMITPEKY